MSETTEGRPQDDQRTTDGQPQTRGTHEQPGVFVYEEGGGAVSNLFYAGAARRTSGGFNVAMKNADKLLRQLQKLETGGETAIKRTVSDFTSRAPAWVSKGIRQWYGVDGGAIKEAGPRVKRGATQIKVSGVSVDGATLEYKGRTLTPSHFNQSPKARPGGQQSRAIKVPGQAVNTASGNEVATIRPPKKYSVKATIIKGSRVSLGPGTFIASGNGGSTLPFQRKSESSRMPIEAVRTLSVPQMISGRAQETIEELVAEKLSKRFEHHVAQIMK